MGLFSKLFGATPAKKAISPYDIVADYGYALEHHAPAPLCVADVGELPHSKDEIKRAILTVLAVTTDAKMREHLKAGYLSLVSWQVGVGPKHQGWDVSKVDMTKSALEIANESVPHTTKMKEWQKVTDAEEKLLLAELQRLGL